MPDCEPTTCNAPWLGLIIGNTRLHWAFFQGQALQAVWHTAHISSEAADELIDQHFAQKAWRSLPDDPAAAPSNPEIWAAIAACQSLPLYCASVVPQQTARWQAYEHFQEVRLADMPLGNLYPTLGIDRALNLLGAGDRYGWPILVIDAGTALTFTAGNEGQLVGGAISPGLSTQFDALTAKAAALPAIRLGTSLPERWSATTSDAIRSGVIYGAIATIQDFLTTWQSQYPQGQAVLTGGDAAQLHEWLTQTRAITTLHQDATLAFKGLIRYRQHRITKGHSS